MNRLYHRLGLPLAALLLAAAGVAVWLLLHLQLQAVQTTAATRLQLRAEWLATSLNSHFRQIELSAHTLAADLSADLGSEASDHARLLRLLSHRLQRNRDLQGAQLLLEADGSQAGLAVHLSRRGRHLDRLDLAALGYAYRQRDWYRQAIAAPQGSWTPAYFSDAAGGRDTLSFHVPLGTDDTLGRGLLSLEIGLDRLESLATSLGLRSSPTLGSAALIDPQGRTIVHPDPRRARSDVRPSVDALLVDGNWTAAGAPRRLQDAQGRRHLAAEAEVGERGWRVLLSQPAPELPSLLRTQLLIGAALLLAIVLLLGRQLLSRSLAPLQHLQAEAERWLAEQGDRDRSNGNDLDRLRRAFERLRATWQAQASALDAADQRDRKLHSELDLAREIQRAMLPRDRVFLTAHRTLSVAGLLQPARAVGGDFYSFFLLDPGEVCFVIGDVSDKGVPSALFAARLNTLLAQHARQSAGPAATLASAASELYRSNDTGLFATVLIGSLRLEDGQLRLAAAGHDPPLRLAANGEREWLPLQAGPALGFEDHADYPQWQGILQPGDQLIGYTDGVTEAMTRDHQEFGSERIEVALERHEPPSPVQTVAAIVDEVEAFCAGAEPADDLTLLVLGLAEREH